MTVDYALFLSPDGIALAHRQAAGHWALVGEAALDGDLDAAMAALKTAAEARGCAGGRVLLVLPDDQVLYTSFMAPADDTAMVEARITEGLEGMTPYAVPDLTYDWRAIEADRIKVAVVAQETLNEAQAFAESHGFQSAGFAAMPPTERFPGMPLFGSDRPDLPDAGGGMAFGADEWTPPAPEPTEAEDAGDAATAEPADPVVEAPPAEDAGTTEATGAPESDEAGQAPDSPSPATGAVAGTERPDDRAETMPETAGDSPGPDDAPAKPDAAAAPDAEVEPLTEPETGPEPEIAAPEPSTSAAGADETPEPPAPVTSGDAPDPEEAGPRPVSDPTLEQPIAPNSDDAQDDGPTEPSDPGTAPGDQTQGDDTAAQDTPAVDDAATAKDRKPGKGSKPSKRLTADKTGPAAARPARTGRITPLAAEPSAPASAAPEDGEDTAAPAVSFSARRGKAPKPDDTGGQVVSARRGRLGLGAASSAGETGPSLHPDAAPAPRAESAPPEPKPGNRLSAQLARVRDASKSRSRPEPPATDTVTAGGAQQPDRADSGAGDDRGGDGASAGGFRRGGAKAAGAGPKTPDADATATADSTFTSGLLARKPVEQPGPSFKTGLILTLILLLLLALIAVWSVLFLPDSPMARLFSGDPERDSASLSEGPADAPAPPGAVSAPPAMGLADPGSGMPADGAEPTADTAPEPEAVIEETAALDPEPEAAPPLSETAAEAALSDPALPAEDPLPDIDADLELPPLPPLPEELLPSLEETQAIYDADGIWPRTPDRPSFDPFSITDDIYVAAIDPTVSAFDALALPEPDVNPDEMLRRVPPPPPFGADIERNAQGLVTPTPEGVLTPDGAFVVLGQPPVAAVPRPQDAAPPAEATPENDVEDAILGTFQPVPRPANLQETRQRQVLGGLTVTELAAVRPPARPLSAQEAAAGASLFPRDGEDLAEGETTPTTAAPDEIGGTRLAVAQSRLPSGRPGNIDAIVAEAERAPARAVAVAAVAPSPSIPSNADVSRAATERDAIRLRDVNLIGVTGTPSNRRALVRLPSGRFVRVGIGDRLDGGRVAAIGDATLQYVRNGRNITLEIPG